jgi:hypothetical protein
MSGRVTASKTTNGMSIDKREILSTNTRCTDKSSLMGMKIVGVRAKSWLSLGR